jgi:hypothetical protein
MNFNKIHEEDHETILLHRARFFDFVNEIDKRHNRNFVKTFPEMAEFYNKCKMAKEKLIPN